jgi:ABC-2 type transport system ATP-binding protein
VLALCGPRLDGGETVNAVLDRVRLNDVADRKVKTYSQGMRQRLGLALALLRDPTVLLLNEPTNGMDPVGIREFRGLLRSLADDGMSVFLSSHLLAEVAHVCDRVVVMNRGRLVEQGLVSELTTAKSRVRVVVAESEQHAARTLLAGWSVRSDGPDALLVDVASGRGVNSLLGGEGISSLRLRGLR